MGVFAPAPCFAFSPLGFSWPNGEYAYRVNVNSFANINGHSVSAAEARFWVQYATSQWVSRTGVDFGTDDFDYESDTTAACDNNSDGINTIGVKSGCAPGGCHINATTFSAFSGSNYVEADICIWGGASNWELQMSYIASSEVDLVGVLVHEIGHALGLDHTSGTVMDAGYLGGALNRYPHGDDIDGLRSVYSAEGLQSLASYWREWDDASDSWSTARSMGGSQSFQPRRADVGANSSGTDYVVTAAVDQDGDQVHFKRATYPLGTSATWSNYAFTYDAWVSPAITSNHDGSTAGRFLAAFPLTTDTESSCGAMRFIYSSGALASGNTTYTKTDMCTLVSPALEWVAGPDHDYYLLVWLDFDFSTEENTGEMLYRTSSDGTNWGSISRTGVFALDTPGLACHWEGDCQLSYVRASTDTPELVNRAVTMSTGGAMTLGSYTTKTVALERESDVVWAEDNNTWLGVYHHSTAYDWLTLAYGGFYSYWNVTNPIPTGGYGSVGEDAEHPAKLAGNLGFGETYLFYVD